MVIRSAYNFLKMNMMKNNIYKILIISLSALTLLSSCEKGLLDKYPSGTLVESNAFMTYENYKSYMYQCYSLFTDKRISSNFSDGK